MVSAADSRAPGALEQVMHCARVSSGEPFRATRVADDLHLERQVVIECLRLLEESGHIKKRRDGAYQRGPAHPRSERSIVYRQRLAPTAREPVRAMFGSLWRY